MSSVYKLSLHPVTLWAKRGLWSQPRNWALVIFNFFLSHFYSILSSFGTRRYLYDSPSLLPPPGPAFLLINFNKYYFHFISFSLIFFSHYTWQNLSLITATLAYSWFLVISRVKNPVNILYLVGIYFLAALKRTCHLPLSPCRYFLMDRGTYFFFFGAPLLFNALYMFVREQGENPCHVC